MKQIAKISRRGLQCICKIKMNEITKNKNKGKTTTNKHHNFGVCKITKWDNGQLNLPKKSKNIDLHRNIANNETLSYSILC